MATTTGGGGNRLTRYRWASRSTLTCKTCWPAIVERRSISATFARDSVQCGLTGENPHWRSIAAQRCRQPGDRRHLQPDALWSKLGTFSVSYNDDRRYSSHYYTADYYQTVYSGAFLAPAGEDQRYNNGDSSANTGKYIALDLSLPLGNWFSAG